jgi:tetratricopeptide (TPR) repeat protein
MAHKYGTDREETWRRVEALLAVAPAHPKGLGLAGRLSFIGERLDDARRYAEAALALEPEDAESWGTLALVAGSRGDYDEQVRCYRRAIAAAPYPWIVNNLTCIYLNRAEHEPDAALRQRLLEEALAVNTSCRQRTSNLHWGEACALSMLGIEADRAHEAAANAVTTYQGSRGELRQKLNADPQLAWLWTQKGPLTA